MTISPEAQEVLAEEQSTLDAVLQSLRGQLQRGSQRLHKESVRARDLTSELVAARRVEDKAMLASDEAVSHGLREQKQDEMASLGKMIAKPYFARLVVEEENEGSPRQFEYKIGFAANPDCRIIDWRKAPISKLYYEYRESDEYSEEIQGRERTGKVLLRNTVDIERERLKKVTCRHGAFVKEGSEWKSLGAGTRAGKGGRTLPHILSLITPEQFRMITEDAETAILIQGIAGSGKTTVALHRLAWLLHQDNSDLSADRSVVLVLSKALQRYVSGTLPSIDVEGVAVLTFAEWAARSSGSMLLHLKDERGQFKRPIDRPGAGIERLVRSLAMLRVLEELCLDARHASKTPEELLVEALNVPKRIIELDESKLIDEDLVKRARERVIMNVKGEVIDACIDALMLRAVQLRSNGVTLFDGTIGRYGHIVADEVQDMSPAELAAVIGAVQRSNDLTLVGDTAQKVDSSSDFPGWEKVRQSCSLKGAESRYLSLAVSHRSTLPIMKLADHIQERQLVTQGRSGRVPIWFRCNTESRGIPAVIDWLNRALERYPDALTAVICATPEESKYALGVLSPTFRSGVRLGDESDFSFDEGIVVTDAAQVKGLEFTNVLIWNPTTKSYPRDERSRNLLYIAVSRAEENLAIVTWGRPTPLLPSFGSKLFRNFDMVEEVEESEPQPQGFDSIEARED